MFPQSKEEAGRATWAVLFNYAAQYPQNPTRDQRLHANNYIKDNINAFVCKDCINHSYAYMSSNPIATENREALVKWLCGLKNHSNRNEGKPEIDCQEFYNNNIGPGCSTCSIINTKEVYKPVAKKMDFNDDFFSVYAWEKRYPSLKKAFNFDGPPQPGVNPNPTLSGSSTPISGPANQESLSTNPFTVGLDDFSKPVEEELDGVLKPLDGIYTFPAQMVGIKPSEFNLAYTPEMAANLITLLNQMFLTNFGSLFSTFVGGVGLLGVSIFAKNNLGHYDKLFLQNLTASMLFHTLNFINPRIKDEVLPSATEFFDGLMTMNFEKVKHAMLYNYKGGNGDSPEELLDMLRAGKGSGLKVKNGIIDMDSLKQPKTSLLGGGASNSFQASTIRDLQASSQSAYDGRLGGVGSLGGGASNSGVLNKSDIERMFNSRAKYRGNGTSMQDFTYSRSILGGYSPDFGMLDDAEQEFSYILDNNLF